MAKGKSKYKADEIDLRSLLRIFISKKWWFIGSFIIVFIAGILFTFLRAPQFSLTSILSISDIEPDDYEILSQYFPEKTDELISFNNISESKKFFSEDFLTAAAGELDFEIDIDELKDTIFIYSAREGILKLTTVFNNAEETYEINEVILNNYLSKREDEINQTYEDLMTEIDLKVASLKEEIDELQGRSGDKDALLEKEIELIYEDYYNLEENRDLLVENKDYFVERIEVFYEPDISNVYEYFNRKRDIIFSFFLAVAIGLIVPFAVNHFQSFKKNKINL
jgi:LPS O-antigen subunit length determinant protein (WzzB/FepE family)